jgi:hypothetical protein
MKPVSPVMPGSEGIEVIYAKDQPEYIPLPAVHLDTPSRPIVSRWRLDNDEREAIASGADIVLTLLSFGMPLTPSHLQVVMPDAMPVLLED